MSHVGIRLAVGLALAWSASAGDAAAACALDLTQDLQGQIVLPAGCVFEGTLRLKKSDTSLNCNGSVFDGGNTTSSGLIVGGRDEPIQNVQVENCGFRNYTGNAITVSYKGMSDDIEENYRRAPKNIRFNQITIENSRLGFFIGSYSSKVVISNSRVSGSFGTAIYLEYSSRENEIYNNYFFRNGFDDDGKRKREALAVDSSANNKIQNNVFDSNGNGSIFLYKNCGEKSSQKENWQRWQHSDRNLISGNVFRNEVVGVWIASRQSRDLSKWDCGDRSMGDSGAYFEDFANENVVADNQFCGTKRPVRIEGDSNQVVNNSFDRASSAFSEVPLSKRGEILGRPPQGNRIESNRPTECR